MEGTGNDPDGNYPWPAYASACTAANAVDWHPTDVPPTTPTKWRDNGTDRAEIAYLTWVSNSSIFTNLVAGQYNYVTLDPSLWWNYLHSMQAGPGLLTRAGPGESGELNQRVYTRKSGTGSCPKLRVTIVKRATNGTLVMLLH